MKKILFCCLYCLLVSLPSFATIFFTVVTSAASCVNVHDGTIIINPPTGGTGPYQYSITGGSFYSSSATFTGLQAGTYNVVVMDVLGDSGSQQVLVFSAGFPSSSSINISVCSNDLPYNFNGTPVFSPGIYSDTLTNMTGCDSIITLNLSVMPVSSSNSNISICPSQLPYTWNGQQYNASGVYTYISPGSSGCDSIATLQLNVVDQWLGTISNSWEEPLNWSCGVPGPASDVLINFGTVILHADATINSLTLNPNAILTVNPGVHLTVLH